MNITLLEEGGLAPLLQRGRSKSMKCPLLMAGYWSSIPGFNTAKTDCLKEECVWWDKNYGHCAILGLSHELSYLASELVEIRNKLPGHERLI